MIYLDYSANTPVDPAVLEAFCKAEQTYIGNPNSTHCAGRTACEEMARVTDHIAGLLGVEPAGIIYTSGASESNNLAIKGIAQASRSTGRHMISTVLEHASVGGTLTALQQQGWEVDLLDIQRDGTWSNWVICCGRTRSWCQSARWTVSWGQCSQSVKLRRF